MRFFYASMLLLYVLTTQGQTVSTVRLTPSANPVKTTIKQKAETVAARPRYVFTEAGGSAATADRIPFWLGANQFGIVPTQSPFGTLRAGAFQDYDSTTYIYGYKFRRRRVDWGYGIEVVGNVGKTAALLIPEAYLKARLGPFELMAGRRREVYGLADTTLGTGSFAISPNALPIPRVQVSLPQFTPIGFTRGILAFQGVYAHGWFDDSGPIKGSYLHQKTLYGRLGKETWPIRFYGGFNHQVQWAGRTDIFTSDKIIKNGRFPSSFSNYIDAVTGASLAARGTNQDTTLTAEGDRFNRIGNHLGSIDIGFEINARRYSVLFYRQSFYEDGSLYYLINIADGLNGIQFRNKKRRTGHGFRIDKVVAEFLYTKNQGGADFGNLPTNRGNDNYYNHGQYLRGWSYSGRTLGTPFIPPASTVQTDLPPAYVVGDTKPPYRIFTNNNRVSVLHLGASGQFGSRYTFALKCSFSDNLGTYITPFPASTRQLSAFLNITGPIGHRRDLLATVSVGADQGKLYDNSVGAYIGIRKVWAGQP